MFYLLFLNHFFHVVNLKKNKPQLIDLWIFLTSLRKAIDSRTQISKVHPETEIAWPWEVLLGFVLKSQNLSHIGPIHLCQERSLGQVENVNSDLVLLFPYLF